MNNLVYFMGILVGSAIVIFSYAIWNNLVYFILNSEINAYLKQIKMVFSQSETI